MLTVFIMVIMVIVAVVLGVMAAFCVMVWGATLRPQLVAEG